MEKHFGKLAPATPGEKQARIAWLNMQIPRETNADPSRGKVLFTRLCAACHVLHGEGGKIGPDLTTADRKNRGYLLTHIIDPSGYIRPEYVVQVIRTVDERQLSGIAREAGEFIELTSFADDKPVVLRVPKEDVEEIRPSSVSLMPEKLLDGLSDSEVADLFAYLQSDPPVKASPPGAAPAPASPAPAGPSAPAASATSRPRIDPLPKKFRVALVSGSFEYKSDASLAEFKKFLEEKYPVECTLISAKAEKDLTLSGIERLKDSDLVVFFTRRLQIEGESLEAVKKYVASKKPIVGIRTASHGFQKWLEMDRLVFGGDYRGHYGPGITDVSPVEAQKDHPVLRGVSAFRTRGTLYKNPQLAEDVVVLLRGVSGERSEPVAWTREADGRRVFYTSLGHPDDFQEEQFRRLLVNAILWAVGIDPQP